MRRREQWVCTAKTQRAPPPPVGRHQINFTLSPPRHCDVIHSSVSPVAMATLPLGAANSLNPSLSRRVNVPPPSPDPSEPSPLAPPEGVQLHHAPTPNCPALCSLLPQCWCRRKEKKKKKTRRRVQIHRRRRRLNPPHVGNTPWRVGGQKRVNIGQGCP